MKATFLLFASIVLFSFSFVSVSRNVNSGMESTTYKSGGGIKFAKMSYGKALKQAKASGKLVFIDVHTSWCGPCKEMAATTFRDGEVGKVFNERFINLKIDAEEDPDGPMVSKKFGITGYPTLLFVDGDGKLVKKVMGKQPKEKLLHTVQNL